SGVQRRRIDHAYKSYPLFRPAAKRALIARTLQNARDDRDRIRSRAQNFSYVVQRDAPYSDQRLAGERPERTQPLDAEYGIWTELRFGCEDGAEREILDRLFVAARKLQTIVR